MTRYVARKPRARLRAEDDNAWARDVPHLPVLTVEVSEGSETGLIDAEGYEILRHKDPIGFIHF